MGKFIRAREYEVFGKSLKGRPIPNMNGEIVNIITETFGTSFGIGLDVVLRDTQVGPDLIPDLLTNITGLFMNMYDEYGSSMGETLVRIRKLIITGGLDIGVNINHTMTSVLPVEKQQWVKDVHTLNDMVQYTKEKEVRDLMRLDEITVERLNRITKQLQSQKNVPHNLQVHLDFLEDGTIKMNDTVEAYYRLPEGIELKCSVDERNHNKITGIVDFKYKPIYVEYPTTPETGKIMKETIVNLLSGKIKQLLELNGLTPENYSNYPSSLNKPIFTFNIKWTGK